MKKLIFILAMLSANILPAQEFVVERVSGSVLVLHGSSEEFGNAVKGQILNGSDLIVTEPNSFIQLNKDGNRFILKGNSALGLSNLKEVSINDLLLALAMEEIRNVQKKPGKGTGKNTAVYGAETTAKDETIINQSKLGEKKINGALQLAQNGYKESAIIVAKETFRKYPATSKNVDNRIYFASLLNDVELYNEALTEFSSLSIMDLDETQKAEVNQIVEQINMKLVSE